jgi:hypothetical protein
MALFRKKGMRSSEVRHARKQFYKKVWIGAAVAFLFAFMYSLTFLGPRGDDSGRPTLDRDAPADPLLNPALIAMRQQVEEKLIQFQQQQESATLAAAEPIEQAINLQRQVIQNRGTAIVPASDLSKLDQLVAARDEFVGNILFNEASELKSAANHEYREGNYDAAAEKLEQVIRIRRDIDRRYAQSTHRNPSQTRQLEQQLEEWLVHPLAVRSEDLRNLAMQALAREEWDEARDKMRQALTLQQELYENHRDSRQASISRLRSFERDWENVLTTQLSHRIDSEEASAREAISRQNWEEAASHAEAALKSHAELAKRSPRHPEVRNDRRSTLETLLATSASAEISQRLQQAEAALLLDLRQRNAIELTRRIGDVYRIYSQFRRSYPNSTFYNEEGFTRIDFLNDMRMEVAFIQELVDNRMRAVPGKTGIYLLETEVWQDLYQKIMGSNPSLQASTLMPVESVNWNEASEFCLRMSWILAEEVSLPSRKTFLAALGRVTASEVPVQSVNSQNSDREIQPIGRRTPNSNGFYDLLGNVGEWLNERDGNQVIAIGGTARDNPVRLASVPEETRLQDERNRYIGFRFQSKRPTNQ